MKNLTTLAVITLLISSAIAQPFSEREYLSSTPFPIADAALIDLEGDGDLDALLGGDVFHSAGIEVWVNNDGDFELSTLPIPFGNFGTTKFVVGDIDLDGDQDFAAIIEETLAWFPNDGSGVFASPITIATNFDPTSNIALGNLDNNPGMEIIIGRELELGQDPELLIYENDGEGNFGTSILVPGNFQYRPRKIVISDVNADGLNDLVMSFWNNPGIAVYLNNSELSFAAPVTIDNGQSLPVGLAVADFDTNGYPDIVSLTSNGLSLYMNSGNGSLEPAALITDNAFDTSSLTTGDFNNDGYTDLFASWNDGSPYLYANDGNGIFSEVSLSSSGSISGLQNVLSGDVDGDGKLDLITASHVDNKLALFEQSNGVVPFGENPFENQQLINNPASGVNSIAAGDIDGDGLIDLVSAENFSGDVTIYRNLAEGALGVREVLLALAEGLSGVQAGDMDGDGDSDLIVTNEDEGSVTLHLNQGGGSSFAAVVVDENISQPYEPFLSDLDNDGDLDILQASGGSAEVLFYPNNGDGSFGASIVLCANCSLSKAISAKDLNGDDLPEVLVSSSQNEEILLYSNLGDLNFGVAMVLLSSISEAKDIEYVDYDNDGDLDVFVAATGESKINFAENLGNLEFSAAQIPIFFTADEPHDLAVLDIDLDGDMDLALTEAIRNRVSIILIEDGTFTMQPIDTPYRNPTILLAEDFTNDGKLDLVAGFVNNLVLYTNLGENCSALRPTNLDVEFTATTATFSWDPTPESVRCRIFYLESSGTWSNKVLPESAVSSFTIPVNAIPSGSTFWKVQCACSTNPLELTQISPLDFIWQSEGLEVFPNPAQEDLQVQFRSNTNLSGMPYRVMDIQGRVLIEGVYQNRINLGSLEAGQYLVEMDGSVARFYKK